MDFVKLLRSFEEFLYEVMAWLIFYPRTLWRVVTRPLEMMTYSDAEQGKPSEKQYADSVSPPLFLILSIGIAHVLELAVHQSGTLREGFRSIFQTDQTFLLLRCVIFGVYPLVFAAALVRRQGRVLDRETLRAPFFCQCYLTAPSTLFMGIAAVGLRMQSAWVALGSALLALLVVVWFCMVETRWFHTRLGRSRWSSLGLTLRLWVGTSLVLVLVSSVLVG